jgi:Pro-kumamolisin, activation domain
MEHGPSNPTQMERFMRFWKSLLPLLVSSLCFAAQPDRITGPIDSSRMVTLPGHVNPNAKPQYDQGLIQPSFQFGYVTLVIAPSPSQQIALDQLLEQQQDRSSANYHKWLTPEQYADRFGLSQNDLHKITAWLTSQGFSILSAPRGRNSVIFSGTAAQVQSSFGTEIHRYDINGEKHFANSIPLSVPAALSGVVTGVRGLSDFLPKPMYVRPAGGSKSPGPHPAYTATLNGQTDYFLAPGDIATIYDLNPLYNASPAIDGTGQTLAIIGQTDIYLADINDFRSGFGLNQITGCTTNAAGIVTACNSTNFQYVVVTGVTDPGTPSACGDLPEADLDIEWSGATARNAQIIFVNAPATFNSDCTVYTNNGGVNNALAYAIENRIAPVISMSYGICEAEAESMETELEQGNTEGITIMNSAGDSGAAACDGGPPNNATKPPFSPAVGGLAVNYPASSPEVTGVGGTGIPISDFTATYWSSSNGVSGGSALTALEGQEVAWNDDVAFAQLCQGDPSNTFCTDGGPPAVSGWVDLTSASTAQEDVWISAGTGGVSNCINQTAEGICTSGFPRPAFQRSITIPDLTSPQSTYRFVPDVSLLASPDYPGYVFCTPQGQWVTGNTSTSSTCVTSIATAVETYYSLVGGTSASSPVFAGIVTLLNQYLGSSGLGSINTTLYSLAASSHGTFHPITSGENDVYCQAGTPSGQPADVICPSNGIFGFEASSADTTTGYNLVTGLGSVDANALAVAWKASIAASDFTLAVTTALSPSSVPAGQTATAVLTIAPVNGSTPTINFTNSTSFAPGSCTVGLPAGALCSFSPASVTLDGTHSVPVTLTITTVANMALPSGAQTITVTGTASDTGGESQTAQVNLTVTATNETFTLSSTNGVTFPVTVGGSAQVNISVAGTNGFIVGSGSGSTTAVPLTYTCTGTPSLPTADINCQVPNTGQPDNAITVSVSLQTTAPTSQLRPPLGGSRFFYALLLPGLFGIVLAAGSRTNRLRLLSLIVVLGVSTLGLGSCSGGGGGTNTSPTNGGTPAQTYAVTINATTSGANPITGSLSITLNVTTP